MAMNTEDYKTNARESGIMVGDYVQITRKAEYGENGWNSAGWSPINDGTINYIGQVIRIDTDWDFFVYFEDIEGWYIYPYFALKRVHRSPIVPRFNIGDRVLIKRSWEKGEYGTIVSFNGLKPKTIGKVGEIYQVRLNRVTHEIYYSIQLKKNQIYACPEFVLREVTNKPNPDFEFEPFDGLLHITGPTLSR